MKTAIERTMMSAAKPKIAPSGRPPLSSGTHVSVPEISPLVPPTAIGICQLS